MSSFLDFQAVIKDYDQFKDVSVSLTKIQPNKKNISQNILGPSMIEELQMMFMMQVMMQIYSRVFNVYLKSWSYQLMSPYMIPSKDSLLIAHCGDAAA